MNGTLLVTETTRSYGEFRRRWVRAAFERYVRRYRQRLVRAVEWERARGPVTLLTARQLLGDARLPSGVSVRYYDEESYKVDSRALGDTTARLVADSLPAAESAPAQAVEDFWTRSPEETRSTVTAIQRGWERGRSVFDMPVTGPAGSEPSAAPEKGAGNGADAEAGNGAATPGPDAGTEGATGPERATEDRTTEDWGTSG